MSTTSQKVCAWCGVGFLALFGLGFLIGGFYPPSPSPDGTAKEMADHFREDKDRIRVGLLVTMFGAALFAPWCIAFTVQMKRGEGRGAPYAWSQAILGVLFILEFTIPIMIMQAAAYRPDRPDEDIQSLIDIGWLMFIGNSSTLLLQGILIGAMILTDKRENPVFPRWSGYFCIWGVTLTECGALGPFFKTGPFAWDGVFSWWMGAIVFGTWMTVMTVVLFRAINQEAAEASEVGAVSNGTTFASAAEVAQIRQELKALSTSAQK